MTIIRHVLNYVLPARAVLLLIAVNLAVFAYQQSLSAPLELAFERNYGLCRGLF